MSKKDRDLTVSVGKKKKKIVYLVGKNVKSISQYGARYRSVCFQTYYTAI